MSGISAFWQSRYRTDAPADMPDNETLRLLLSHHSVRAYLPDPLPPGALEIGIAAASSVATSSNLQSWSVVAVEDAETRKKIAALCGNQKHVQTAPLFLARVADLGRLERIADRSGFGHEALEYQEAFLMSSLDTGIAAQNAVTAFESLGLGTVYIGGLRNHPDDVAELLGLPPQTVAVVGLCVGYPDPEHPPGIKPPLPQDAVLPPERPATAREAEAIGSYDQRADAYQQEQGLPSRAWSDTVAERVARVKGLGGRHVIHDVLNRLGFLLK